MKTLKLFIALCFFLTFVSSNVNAQKGVMKEDLTINFGGQFLECTQDYLWGYATIEVMYMPNNMLIKSKKVEVKGYIDPAGTTPSGNDYEIHQIYAGTENWVTTGMFFLNGKNIAVFQWHYHLTTNANGEVTAEFFNYRIDCK